MSLALEFGKLAQEIKVADESWRARAKPGPTPLPEPALSRSPEAALNALFRVFRGYTRAPGSSISNEHPYTQPRPTLPRTPREENPVRDAWGQILGGRDYLRGMRPLYPHEATEPSSLSHPPASGVEPGSARAGAPLPRPVERSGTRGGSRSSDEPFQSSGVYPWEDQPGQARGGWLGAPGGEATIKRNGPPEPASWYHSPWVWGPALGLGLGAGAYGLSRLFQSRKKKRPNLG